MPGRNVTNVTFRWGISLVTTSDSPHGLRTSIQRSVASVGRSALTFLVVRDGSRTVECLAHLHSTVPRGVGGCSFGPHDIQRKLRKLQADVFIVSCRLPQVLAICKINFDTSLLHIFPAKPMQIIQMFVFVWVCPGNGVLYPKISWLSIISHTFPYFQ